MTLKVALQSCPVENMDPKKETSLLLGAEAYKRYDNVYLYTVNDLFLEGTIAYAWARKVKIDSGDSNDLHYIGETEKLKLDTCDVILIRQNPPVDGDYLTSTYILDYVGEDTLFVNNPASIRSLNGKIFPNKFSKFVVPSIMGNNINTLLDFYKRHNDVILKPMNGFGGAGIFRIKKSDNPIQIFKEFRKENKGHFIVQQYIPDAAKGDKRIIIFDGAPVAALLRVPLGPDKPANITQGASIEKVEITARENELCKEITPILREQGLFFVGLDMLGDYIAEINIISVGTLRPANNLYNIKLEEIFWDKVEKKLADKKITKAIC